MVEAPLHEIENIQHDNLIPFSGPDVMRRGRTTKHENLEQRELRISLCYKLSWIAIAWRL
jgi:hypothetical protein